VGSYIEKVTKRRQFQVIYVRKIIRWISPYNMLLKHRGE